VSFFEPIPEPEAELDPRHVSYRQPEWDEAPINERPVAVALNLTLARTDDVAVFVSDVSVYSTGLVFEVEMMARERTDDSRDFMLSHAESDADPRLGVLLADGRRAVLGDWGGQAEGTPEIAFRSHGGQGGGHHWAVHVWLWPIPPEGPVTFVFRWLAAGIEETRVAVDAAPLREAAARAEALWPDERPERPAGGSGWGAYA
jgi:hypothetical protein